MAFGNKLLPGNENTSIVALATGLRSSIAREEGAHLYYCYVAPAL